MRKLSTLIILYLITFSINVVFANDDIWQPAHNENTDAQLQLEDIQTTYYFNPQASCTDFLREFDADAPAYFKYDRCELKDSNHGAPVNVRYKIEGKYAKQAEQYLIDKFNINELRFICCYWSTGGWPSSSFINPKDNTSYLLSFASEETLSSLDWHEVTFYLTIEVLRDDI